MTSTLTLWDFDDTLAYSFEAVDQLSKEQPEVEGWMWWHLTDKSTEAVMITEAITEMWEKLVATPGRHMILTARNGEAVEAWINTHKNDEGVIGEGIAKIERVITTSNAATAHVPAAMKKAIQVGALIGAADKVVMVDDSAANLAAIGAAYPQVELVQVNQDLSAAQN